MSEQETLEEFEKIVKPLKVSEFKTWLEGIMEFQSDDWTPNLQQWNTILEKINRLEESQSSNSAVQGSIPLKKEPKQSPDVVQQLPHDIQYDKPAPEKPSEPISLEGPKTQLPETSGKKNIQNPVQRTSPVSVEQVEGQRVIDTGELHKREPIDTSDGNYVSEFL